MAGAFDDLEGEEEEEEGAVDVSDVSFSAVAPPAAPVVVADPVSSTPVKQRKVVAATPVVAVPAPPPLVATASELMLAQAEADISEARAEEAAVARMEAVSSPLSCCSRPSSPFPICPSFSCERPSSRQRVDPNARRPFSRFPSPCPPPCLLFQALRTEKMEAALAQAEAAKREEAAAVAQATAAETRRKSAVERAKAERDLSLIHI